MASVRPARVPFEGNDRLRSHFLHRQGQLLYSVLATVGDSGIGHGLLPPRYGFVRYRGCHRRMVFFLLAACRRSQPRIPPPPYFLGPALVSNPDEYEFGVLFHLLQRTGGPVISADSVSDYPPIQPLAPLRVPG